MAEKSAKKNRYKRKIKAKSELPYSKVNYQIFGAGILLLLVGYWALAQGPVNGFLSLTLAPILLVIAYCVVIPFAIMYKGKHKSNEPSPH
ncbi:MAG: hypothetical protein ACE5HS_03350 [bacterium]